MSYKNIITSLVLGFGVALVTLSPVAEANPAAAAAKAIFKGGKVVSKAKPIKIKIPTSGTKSASRAVPSSGGSCLPPAAVRAAVREQNRREREQRAQKRSSWGW